MEIQIDKDRIYNQVTMVAEYVAAKSDAYEHVRITDEQQEMLEVFVQEGVDGLSAAMRKYLRGSVLSAEGAVITLRMAANHNAGWEQVIERTMEDYLTNYVLSKWFEVVAKDLVEQYATAAGLWQVNLLHLVGYRSAPVRPEYN